MLSCCCCYYLTHACKTQCMQTKTVSLAEVQYEATPSKNRCSDVKSGGRGSMSYFRVTFPGFSSSASPCNTYESPRRATWGPGGEGVGGEGCKVHFLKCMQFRLITILHLDCHTVINCVSSLESQVIPVVQSP